MESLEYIKNGTRGGSGIKKERILKIEDAVKIGNKILLPSISLSDWYLEAQDPRPRNIITNYKIDWFNNVNDTELPNTIVFM